MSCLDGVVDRQPFAGEWGRTGATFERGKLADGTPVVIKFVRQQDWVVRASGGVSHVADLWRAGTFDRVPPVIDHAILAVEEHGDGWVILMRDVGDAMLAEGSVVDHGQSRRILAAADALHAAFYEQDVPGEDLLRRYETMTPRGAARFGTEQSVTPLIVRGWERFPEVAPPDVCAAMSAILDDPSGLAAAMRSRPCTLIHGDLRLHNIGLTGDRVVLIDWEVAGPGPPAIDVAWYLIISASRLTCTREHVLDDYRSIAGERYDPVGVELAMIGALAWLGWNKALDILEHPDPVIRERERGDLDWWVERVRRSLDTWSPPSR